MQWFYEVTWQMKYFTSPIPLDHLLPNTTKWWFTLRDFNPLIHITCQTCGYMRSPKKLKTLQLHNRDEQEATWQYEKFISPHSLNLPRCWLQRGRFSVQTLNSSPTSVIFENDTFKPTNYKRVKKITSVLKKEKLRRT